MSKLNEDVPAEGGGGADRDRGWGCKTAVLAWGPNWFSSELCMGYMVKLFVGGMVTGQEVHVVLTKVSPFF
jgi:hypothetical protein